MQLNAGGINAASLDGSALAILLSAAAIVEAGDVVSAIGSTSNPVGVYGGGLGGVGIAALDGVASALPALVAFAAITEGRDVAAGVVSSFAYAPDNAHVVHLANRLGSARFRDLPTIVLRSSDVVLIDVDCTRLLSPGEVIQSVTAEADSIAIARNPVIITAAQTYPDGITAGASQAVQLQVVGGALPQGQFRADVAVRPLLVTNYGEVIEATFMARIQNTQCEWAA